MTKEILTFSATVSGTEQDEYSLTAGVYQPSSGLYVNFQRCATGIADDEGVYFEYNDQMNGQYNCISSVRVERNFVSVKLNQSASAKTRISEVEVNLNINDSEYSEFVAALKTIFRNTGGLLRILV